MAASVQLVLEQLHDYTTHDLPSALVVRHQSLIDSARSGLVFARAHLVSLSLAIALAPVERP